MNKILMLFCCFFFTASVYAITELTHFDNPAQEQAYVELTQQLRCLVCQNESLADSQSSLAQDMRQEIMKRVVEGQDKKEIINYLTSRYGDFILYKPPVQKNTYLLWLFPFALFVLGMVVLFIVIRRRRK